MRGLAAIEWPARFQKWDERTIIDGAHNPSAARILAQTWREVFGDQKATLMLAVLSDKDLRGICEALAPIAESVLLPKIRSERGADPEELSKVLSDITPPLPCSITPNIGDALMLARAKPNPILITGSLHFAGEVLAICAANPLRSKNARSGSAEASGSWSLGPEPSTPAVRYTQLPYKNPAMQIVGRLCQTPSTNLDPRE